MMMQCLIIEHFFPFVSFSPILYITKCFFFFIYQFFYTVYTDLQSTNHNAPFARSLTEGAIDFVWGCLAPSSTPVVETFFLESRGMGNKITITCLGRDRKNVSRSAWEGPGIVITLIPNFIHKYTFYINKLFILILNLILVALSLYALLLFALVWLVKWMKYSTPVTVGGGNSPSWYAMPTTNNKNHGWYDFCGYKVLHSS